MNEWSWWGAVVFRALLTGWFQVLESFGWKAHCVSDHTSWHAGVLAQGTTPFHSEVWHAIPRSTRPINTRVELTAPVSGSRPRFIPPAQPCKIYIYVYITTYYSAKIPWIWSYWYNIYPLFPVLTLQYSKYKIIKPVSTHFQFEIVQKDEKSAVLKSKNM